MDPSRERSTGARDRARRELLFDRGEAVRERLRPEGATEAARSERAPAEPRRPEGWKPTTRYVGDLRLRFAWPAGVARARGLRLSVVELHRPAGTDLPRVERSLERARLEDAVELEELPAGDHLIVSRVAGYRPYAQLASFSADRREVEIAFPLRPARTPEQEEELLRRGEAHPWLATARRYLTHFGYLRERECGCRSEALCEHLGAALRRFQETFRLAPLGSLTVDTLLLMLRPRCACPDVPLEASSGPTGVAAQDPIVFTGSRWEGNGLRYRFESGTGDVTNEWSIVEDSLDVWAASSALSFQETTDPALSNLEFDFRQSGEAGYPFDQGGDKGGGNTLAHAFPPLDGLVEFDDHEDWGEGGFLKDVAVHEIGHALGLGHSSVEQATMYPYHDSGFDTLHEVDIRGVKSLYPPVFRHPGPFIVYPLYGFQKTGGTDTVRIDMGRTHRFLAWGTITMVDSLADYDRDNMGLIDVFEVDEQRTGWRLAGGDHFGSADSPANAYEGAVAGFGRSITFRITAGHTRDLEISGFAIVLVLD